MDGKNSKNDSRRHFLKKLSAGGVMAASGLGVLALDSCKEVSKETTTVMTPEGKLVQIPNSEIQDLECHHPAANPEESRKGIPGKKFVMVVDLAKCKNARKCVNITN
jgi:molybdopterin-containing oxidoreductase family iron-sulfur binding subunit